MKKKNRSGYLLTIIVLICLSFFLPRLVPGSPVSVILKGGSESGLIISDEAIERLEERFGLDKPLWQQFCIHLKNIMRFDFGDSYIYHRPVIEVVGAALPWTLLLVLIGTTLAMFFGIKLGIESAYRHNQRFDQLMTGVVVFISGFPQFLVGVLLLLVFGIHFPLFPIASAVTALSDYGGINYLLDILHHLVLPVTTLVLTEIPGIYLLVRNSGSMVKNKPYYFTALARGLSPRYIKRWYLGSNIKQPIISYIGMRLGRLLVGELMIEVVFSYPGLGSLMYNSISNRDYPVIQGMLLLVAVTMMVSSLLVEHINKSYSLREGGQL